MIRAWFVALLVFGLQTPAFAQNAVRVHDGDTLTLNGTRIRLWGIDAPELDQPCEQNGQDVACGDLARVALVRLTQSGNVICHEQARDRYGRSVARCYVGTVELSVAMVEQGFALDYPQYSHGEFAAQELAARRSQLGIWAMKFIPPWQWRAQLRRHRRHHARRPRRTRGAASRAPWEGSWTRWTRLSMTPTTALARRTIARTPGAQR